MPHSEAGPLAGLRLAVKDLFDVAGYPTGAGNPLVLAASGVKGQTAPAVQRLLQAGAAFVGKAKTDELAYSLLGINRHFGTPHQSALAAPHSGGSSSGSAVAVAAGLAEIGLGTDTSGSVRLPATANGVFGWRSSHGLLPLEGCRPLAPSFDTLGILTPSLEGMRASMLAYDLSESSPIRRLLIPRSLLALCESSIRQAFETALEASEIPVTLIDFLSDSELADAASAFTTILQREAWLSNSDLFREARDSLDPTIAAARLEQGRTIDAEPLLKARCFREVITAQCDALMETDASFCLPTLPHIHLGSMPRRRTSRLFARDPSSFSA